MNVYQDNLPEEEKKKPSKHPDNPNGGIFPRSALNDYIPVWEKIVFFLIGFLGLNIISVIVSIVIQSIPGMLVRTENGYLKVTSLASALVNFLTYALLVIIFLLFLFLDKRGNYRRYFASYTHPKSYLFAFVGLLAIFLMQKLFSVCYDRIPFYSSNDNQTSLESLSHSYPALLFFMTVFFAPFCEELTYRVGLLDAIGNKYKYRWLGIVLSAIFFGFIHFDFSAITDYWQILADSESTASEITKAMQSVQIEFLNLPIYVLSGFFLGLTYALSGEIASSTTAHMVNNLIGFLAIIITAAASEGNSSSAVSLLSFLPHFLF